MTEDATPLDEAEQVIDPDLLAKLICPVDRQELRLEGRTLVCTACGRSYPIENGVPNMLVDIGS